MPTHLAAMKDALEAMNGASYTEPVYILGSMDNEISFNDRVMLHNTEIEERLDHLLEVWKKANSECDTNTVHAGFYTAGP